MSLAALMATSVSATAETTLRIRLREETDNLDPTTTGSCVGRNDANFSTIAANAPGWCQARGRYSGNSKRIATRVGNPYRSR